MNEKQYWDQIYDEDGIYQEKCWADCNSYCCNSIKGFKFLDNHQTIPFFPGEYEYLEKQGFLQSGFKETHNCTDLIINGEKHEVHTVKCILKGICSNHKYRPVICRLYPLFPRVDYYGKIEEFEWLWPVDLFWEDLARNNESIVSPCKLNKYGMTTINRLIKMCAMLCEKPINIFYIKLANLYKSELYMKIHTEIVNARLSTEEFIKIYENTILDGTYLENMENEATKILKRMQLVHGEVLCKKTNKKWWRMWSKGKDNGLRNRINH
jgi:hypothetical protein